MLKINYKIKIGSTIYTANDKTLLLDLRSQSSLQVPVNTCQIVLGIPKNVQVAPKDPISVEIGYDRQTSLVFTGRVMRVDWEIDRINIEAASTLTELTLLRINRVYEKSHAGDIVKDILKQANLTVGKVENGIEFAVYAVGDRETASDRLQNLAQQCGFDMYANERDRAIFAQYSPANTHTFTYGENILKYQSEQPQTGIDKIEIYGESPASQGQGNQAYSWLTKKEVKATAGSGKNVLRLADPTARSQAVAQNIARGMLTHLQQKQHGQIAVIGTANVKLGEAIQITKMPISKQNGTFKVTGVRHTINRRNGFLTTIYWEKK
ncbi:contractile injection system protein, VgrG/Pvc8 family [Kamptonema sp. UHCC 0994]|uniref:contractile injection system protein, VgrG/Pvc8 family n=1 Tax=Kamptonema sp. UHCC 0994 TaxID=3031329 RepID=UPI0023B90D13|nr:contractile injection system protein, VgrG/Pvc8 family [Kamptonema sp. UHCC 0994]MDF0551811.1 contractile injection system protein, VgrG/Pvc8 family [Kamptonema sp. UHCC 0994]